MCGCSRVCDMKQFFQFICFSVLLAFLVTGCSERVEQGGAGVETWVTVLPQKFFVERVAGGELAVNVLVRPGQSPETYAPSASQMARMARAELYFGVGMPLEGPLFSKMAQSMPGVRVLSLREPEQGGHVHHAGCVHGANDPHVWLDPVQMIEFVEMVREVLTELLPEKAEVFTANAAQLASELQALDVEIGQRLSAYRGRAFYINHPSLGHWSERYGLHQLSIESSGSAPSAKRIAALVADAKIEKVGAIFTQPEFGQSSARVLGDALGVELIEINPLAEDYFANMRSIAENLERSFTYE